MLRLTPPRLENETFTNPLFRGADPWVVRHEGNYYWCNTGLANSIEIWKSASLPARGQRHTIWTAPRTGWNRAQVWAPELHFLENRWHVYYAASNGRNENHRMGALRSVGSDPLGPYVDLGKIDTADRWAIDGTILQHSGRLYFIWSGWEADRDVQHLYGAAMDNPWTVRGPRVMLCPNDCHLWERVNECHSQRGLHEGPQILQKNGRTFLIYSCSGSWQSSYKLGMLLLVGDDPLNSKHWQKHTVPVFESTRQVFGVGHCCFTTSPDGREDWLVYHAKTRRSEGWSDRVVRAQRFDWKPDGTPDFGSPIPNEISLARPGGEVSRRLSAA